MTDEHDDDELPPVESIGVQFAVARRGIEYGFVKMVFDSAQPLQEVIMQGDVAMRLAAELLNNAVEAIDDIDKAKAMWKALQEEGSDDVDHA